jgi:acetyltransferase-like isoleucine patch superfamily enzyme
MKVGKNCTVSPRVSVYGGDAIEIGDNVRIDDFCVLSGGAGLKIGSHIHIACYASFFAGSGIEIGDFSQIAAYSLLLSESDDFTGQSLIGPQVPRKFKPGYKAGKPIVFGRHVTLGAKCTILPGVTMGEGAIVAAHSLVAKDCDPWTLYAGTPAKPLKERSRDMLALEAQFLAEYAEAQPVTVSVVVLTYNHERFLRECLDGILMQRAPFRYEILVHDDASTDKTPEILREYAERFPQLVRPFFEKENQFKKTGVYPILPLYAAARGKYVAECDGDDFWTDPLKLQKQVDYMEAHPDCVLCHHDYEILQDGKLRPPENDEKPRDFEAMELIGLPVGGYGIGCCTRMWRNIYSPGTAADFEAFWGEYPTNVMFGMHGKCGAVSGISPSVYRRRHGGNSWCSLPPDEMNRRTREMHRRVHAAMVRKGNPRWVAIRQGFPEGGA